MYIYALYAHTHTHTRPIATISRILTMFAYSHTNSSLVAKDKLFVEPGWRTRASRSLKYPAAESVCVCVKRPLCD